MFVEMSGHSGSVNEVITRSSRSCNFGAERKLIQDPPTTTQQRQDSLPVPIGTYVV